MKAILISSVLLLLTGCHQILKNKQSQKINIQQVNTNNISNEFINWVAAVNKKSVDSIKKFYRQNQ